MHRQATSVFLWLVAMEKCACLIHKKTRIFWSAVWFTQRFSDCYWFHYFFMSLIGCFWVVDDLLLFDNFRRLDMVMRVLNKLSGWSVTQEQHRHVKHTHTHCFSSWIYSRQTNSLRLPKNAVLKDSQGNLHVISFIAKGPFLLTHPEFFMFIFSHPVIIWRILPSLVLLCHNLSWRW